MPIRSDDQEPAELGYPRIRAKPNIGAATRHVRRNRDGAERAGARDEGGFLLVVLRVEDDAAQAHRGQGIGEILGLAYGAGTGEDGPARAVLLRDLRDERSTLGVFRPEDDVGEVDPDGRPHRRDDDRPHAVGRGELRGCGNGGRGHRRQSREESHEVLDGDRAEDLALRPDLQSLLGLEGRLDAPRPLPPLGHAAGERVDELDLAALDDVVDVPREEPPRVEGGEEPRLHQREPLLALSLGSACGPPCASSQAKASSFVWPSRVRSTLRPSGSSS